MKSNSASQPHIGIPQKDMAAIAQSLNELLSDQHVLYVKMRNFHWNLVGPSFVEVHRFIEDLYDQLAEDIDIVAERINQLGQYAYGSMAEFLEHSSLKESTGGKKEQHLVITELAADNDTSARKIRELIALIEEKYEDPSTVDILTDLIRNHEKNAWMLRRYLG